jgi:hypothetical protein
MIFITIPFYEGMYIINAVNYIFYNAFEVYGRSVLIRDNANPERPNNEWFDEKCATARRSTFSKYLEIVSLSTTHFGFRFGLTADQNFLGSVFVILQSSIPFLRLKIACALRLVLLNRFLAEMYE